MKQLIKQYSIFFLCFTIIALNAQDKMLDSLKNQLKNANNDKARCSILIDLSNASNENDWLKYVDEAIIISEKNLNNLNVNKHDIIAFKKCYASALILKAGELEMLGNIPSSINLYFKGLKINEDINDAYGCYACYASLSNLYNNLNEQTKAIEFANKSLKASTKLKDQIAICTSFNLLGNAFFKLKNYSTAINYYKKMLEMSVSLNNEQFIASSYNNIGMIYNRIEQYDTALYYLYKVVEIGKTLEDKRRLPTTFNNIADIFISKKELAKALNYATKSFLLAKEVNNLECIASSSKSLYLIYKNSNKNKLALENYELYIKMRDSLLNQDTRRASIKSELKYGYEKKAAADSVKVAEEKKLTTVKLKQEKVQRYYLYGGLGLVGLFALFMVNRFRVTNKQKKLIEEQKKVVETQKEIVDEKQKEILDSIHYAKRIQKAMFPNKNYINRILLKHKD